MKHTVIRYVTWPRDKVRSFIPDKLTDFHEAPHGILLKFSRDSSLFIPWANVIDITIGETKTRED